MKLSLLFSYGAGQGRATPLPVSPSRFVHFSHYSRPQLASVDLLPPAPVVVEKRQITALWQKAASRFVDLNSIVLQSFQTQTRFMQPKPVVIAAPVAAIAAVEAEKPRGTLSLKTKPLSLSATAPETVTAESQPQPRSRISSSRTFTRLSQRSSINELASAFRAELSALEQKRAAGLTPRLDEPEIKERRAHPLSHDLAAAFKAEMQAILADPEKREEVCISAAPRKNLDPRRTRILAA